METNADSADGIEALEEKSPTVVGRKPRRFFQFTLRQILLLCALVGVLLSLMAPRIRWNFHVRRIQEDFRRREAAESKLREAVRKNDVSLARQALEAGADPNLDFHSRRFSPQSPGPSVLNTCIANGQIEMIDLLLFFEADIERLEGIPRGVSNPIRAGPPLFAAAGCNQPAEVRERMVRLLLARGANPRRLVSGDSVMDMAFEMSDAPMGDLWREFGLPYGPREMAAFNRLDELKAAVKETPEILRERYRSAYGDRAPSLLAIALLRGYREMSLLLIEAGAPLDVMDGRYTLLHNAARGGDPQLIRVLVERGLDVNVTDRYSDTPLSDIAWSGRAEVIAALIELGADVNWRGLNGQTPLHHAVRNNRLEVGRLLLAAGADPSLPDNKGETPLQLSKGRNAEIARLLEQAVQDK